MIIIIVLIVTIVRTKINIVIKAIRVIVFVITLSTIRVQKGPERSRAPRAQDCGSKDGELDWYKPQRRKLLKHADLVTMREYPVSSHEKPYYITGLSCSCVENLDVPIRFQ